MYSNLWDATKAILKENVTVINDYIKKKERSQINILTVGYQSKEIINIGENNKYSGD